MVSSAEIIDYISARIINDLDFLAAHGFMSREDQSLIRSRLPGAPVATPGPQVQRGVTVSMPNPTVPSYNNSAPAQSAPGMMNTNFPLKQVTSPPALKRAVPPPPPAATKPPDFCRANWDYNVDLSEPNDLMFRKGDTIELVEETNDDWWTGICRGRSGLFPSNHCARIPYDPHLFPTPPDGGTPPPTQNGNNSGYDTKSRYDSTPQIPGPSSMPPQQQQQGMPPYIPNTPTPSEPQKKGKFGKVGGQLGNAMVNGVGFGAGAAIGGGIIDAIF